MRLRSVSGLVVSLVMAGGLAAACQQPPAAAPATPPPAATTAATPAARAETGTPASAAKPAAPSGTLRVAITRMSPNLDPMAQTTANAGQEAGDAVTDRLTEWDAQGNLVPGLAASWQAAADGVTWTIRLRPEARFSNGDPLTANDVKFSYERFMNPQNGYSSFFRLQPFIREITVVDTNTLRMVTPTLDALFTARLSYLPIVNERSFNAIGVPNMVNQAPAGTGPFMVQSRDGDRLRLVPNPNAWRQPRIANVEIVGLTEIAVRLAALKTGEVDMAASILPETVADLRAEGRNVVTVPNFAQTVVLLDSASPDAAPALKDRRVREALSIAIDRQALVQAIAPNIGTPGYQAVAPEAFGYNPALPPIRTDLARARQLVQQSGFAGSTLKMSGVFTAGLGSLTSAQAIVQMMSQTGINVEINQLELAVFLQRYNGGGGDPLMLFPLGAAHHDADGAIANFRDQGNPNRAAVRYSNPEYDAAYQATLRELDRDRRRALLQQAIKILYDDWAVIPLGSVPGIFALDRKVQNFKPYEQFVWNWNEMAVQ